MWRYGLGGTAVVASAFYAAVGVFPQLQLMGAHRENGRHASRVAGQRAAEKAVRNTLRAQLARAGRCVVVVVNVPHRNCVKQRARRIERLQYMRSGTSACQI